MRKLLTTSVLFLLPFVGIQAHDLSGTYAVEGYDPILEENYTGTAEILKNGHVYNIFWQFSDDGYYFGTGFIEDHVFTVVSNSLNNAQLAGVNAYKIHGDKLSGRWLNYGDNRIGHETLEKVDTGHRHHHHHHHHDNNNSN